MRICSFLPSLTDMEFVLASRNKKKIAELSTLLSKYCGDKIKVLSLDDINLLIELQGKSYPPQRAYEYFVDEFMNVLHYVFGLKEKLDDVGVDNTEEKTMLRNTIITVALKAYLDMCFAVIHEEKNRE